MKQSNEYRIFDNDGNKWGHWNADSADEALHLLFDDFDEHPESYSTNPSRDPAAYVVIRVVYSETMKRYVTIPED